MTIHALIARATRATREATPDADLSALATAAADGLLQSWPNSDQHCFGDAAVLRANTDVLADHTGERLWHPEGHPVLFRAGTSLRSAGLAHLAIAYWQSMANRSERLLGGNHPDTLIIRGNLAVSYREAGRTGDAIKRGEQVAAVMERFSEPSTPIPLPRAPTSPPPTVRRDGPAKPSPCSSK